MLLREQLGPSTQLPQANGSWPPRHTWLDARQHQKACFTWCCDDDYLTSASVPGWSSAISQNGTVARYHFTISGQVLVYSMNIAKVAHASCQLHKERIFGRWITKRVNPKAPLGPRYWPTPSRTRCRLPSDTMIHTKQQWQRQASPPTCA